ncbi:UNVERIFIED_CONTAM: reverse transcriptase-like protein, partial [Salmonella enterica subsp. enterica serovar Weltevreden]
YEALDEIKRKYLGKVKKLIPNFEEVTVEHISRVQNKKADALSKLASSSVP